MIYYGKLFELMKIQGKNTTQIREEKIVGQETWRKLRTGTGILENYDYKVPYTSKTERRMRESAVDTKSIESLCIWLNCQPDEIMEVIPNKWSNADKLCEVLKCTREELPGKIPMEEE